MNTKRFLLYLLIFTFILPLFTCQKYDDGKWYWANFWKRRMTGEFDITSITIDGKEYIDEYAKLYGAKPRAVITKGRYGKPQGGRYPYIEEDYEVTLKVEYFLLNTKVWYVYWRPEPERFPDSIFSSDSESRFLGAENDDDTLLLLTNSFLARRYYIKSAENPGFSIYSKRVYERKDSLVVFNTSKKCEIHYSKTN